MAIIISFENSPVLQNLLDIGYFMSAFNCVDFAAEAFEESFEVVAGDESVISASVLDRDSRRKF